MSSPISPEDGIANLIQSDKDILATNYVGTASMAILIFDHLLTFDDEVMYIWKRRKGIVGTLFLINRYLTPIGFIINMIAYLSPAFQGEHFVRYEGAFTTVSLGIVAIMMIVRLHALYGGQSGITVFVITLFLAQVSVQAWLLSGARPVPHVPGQNNCTMIFAADVGAFSSLYAWLPLAFDTAVLALTVSKTVSSICAGTAGNIVRTFVKDGILYYSVLFSLNLIFAVMLVAAPDGIKGVIAQLEQLLTVTMMSRITINLKKQSSDGESIILSTSSRGLSFGTEATSWRGFAHRTEPPQGAIELSVFVDKEVTVR